MTETRNSFTANERCRDDCGCEVVCEVKYDEADDVTRAIADFIRQCYE